MGERTYVFDRMKNEEVVPGVVIEDTVYIEKKYHPTIKKLNHFVWMYRGFGVDEMAMRNWHLAGVKNVRIRWNKKVFTSKMEDWITKGILNDLGAGSQFFMPIKDMTLESKPGSDSSPQQRPRDPGLFDAGEKNGA